MTERPILFRDDMVSAILDGRKSVTRRVGATWAKVRAGDRLWVREAWQLARADRDCEGIVDDEILWSWPIPKTDPRGSRLIDDWVVGYRADCSIEGGWRPSIHMPRWACRLTLDVVSVTEQRAVLGGGPGQMAVLLPDVDDDEARREGFADRPAFLAAWKSMHPDHRGPVWRVAFKPAEGAHV